MACKFNVVEGLLQKGARLQVKKFTGMRSGFRCYPRWLIMVV